MWHDRAVFHFLTDPADQSSYSTWSPARSAPAERCCSTFAEDGPTHCSGLPTARYSVKDLTDLFSAGFDLEEHIRETHQTPAGAGQSFTLVKPSAAFGQRDNRLTARWLQPAEDGAPAPPAGRAPAEPAP